MNNWKITMRNEDRNDDPPYSRLFIVCNKQLRIEHLRTEFEAFGSIQDIHMPRDRETGASKGIAYIKYAKTSSAAAAIHELHNYKIGDCPKPIRVMIATNRNDNQDTTDEKYRRLFIKVSKDAKTDDLNHYFSTFGCVESVHIQRDKDTDESRGFAYVIFRRFLDAATALEGCDKKYKALFATPKDELKRSRNNDNYNDKMYSSNPSISKDYNNYSQSREDFHKREMTNRLQNYETVWVTCTPQVPQKYLEKLFNVIPGVTQFRYTLDSSSGVCKATVTYDTQNAATCAIERLNNFEFPSGQVITVKPENPISLVADNLNHIVNSFKNVLDKSNPDLAQLADAIAHASSLIKDAAMGRDAIAPAPLSNVQFCSVPLPNIQPLAGKDSTVAKRCFLVFKPVPPPSHYLKDAFCRFGDLIDVITYPNKTFGFARYASVRAADGAIKTLNGAVLYGIKLKVLEADDKVGRDEKRIDDENIMDHDGDRKRMKIHD